MVHYLVETDFALKEIAFRVNLSYCTAKHYTSIIYAFAKVNSRLTLMKKCEEDGIKSLLYKPEPEEELTLS